MPDNRRVIITTPARRRGVLKTRSILRNRSRYYYKIYPENTIPEKKWLTTHSPIFRDIFESDPEWQETRNLQQLDFTDMNEQSPIKNFFKTRDDITTKIFLARLLQRKEIQYSDVIGLTGPTGSAAPNIIESRPDFYPPTLVCESGRVDPILSENQALYQADKPGKWYLKPSKGSGGSGITIVSSPQKAREHFFKKARGMPEDIAERYPLKAKNQKADYVLQRGIERPLLLQGFKFDMRVILLFTFNQKRHFKSYVYKDAFLRVSTKPYQEDSNNPLINLTNLTFHKKQQSVIGKTYTYKSRDFYQATYPKIHEACREIVDRLRDHLIPEPYKGYEIMGFDFMFDEDLKPYLLEINRFVGWPRDSKNKSVVNLIYGLMREAINLAIKPLINPSYKPSLGGWDPLLTFSI